jgi:hypothetical protein
MKNKVFLRVAFGFGLVALSGCAPTVWVKTNATPAEFTMDNALASLRLFAERVMPYFTAKP